MTGHVIQILFNDIKVNKLTKMVSTNGPASAIAAIKDNHFLVNFFELWPVMAVYELMDNYST